MLLRIDDVVSGFKKKKETKSGPVAPQGGAPEQETVNIFFKKEKNIKKQYLLKNN